MTDGSMKDVTDDWTLRFINFGSTAFFGRYEYDTTWGTDVPAVSKTGYTFSGYYDSLSGGNRVYGSTYAKESGLYWDDDSRWIGPSLILYAARSTSLSAAAKSLDTTLSMSSPI